METFKFKKAILKSLENSRNKYNKYVHISLLII